MPPYPFGAVRRDLRFAQKRYKEIKTPADAHCSAVHHCEYHTIEVFRPRTHGTGFSGLGLGQGHWLRLAGDLGAVRGLAIISAISFRHAAKGAFNSGFCQQCLFERPMGERRRLTCLTRPLASANQLFLSNDAFCVPEADSPGKAQILLEGLGLIAENGLSAAPIMDITGSTG